MMGTSSNKEKENNNEKTSENEIKKSSENNDEKNEIKKEPKNNDIKKEDENNKITNESGINKESKNNIMIKENKNEIKNNSENSKEQNNKNLKDNEHKMDIENEKEENDIDKDNKDKKKIKKEMKINELEELINYKYNEKGELLDKKTGEKCGRLSTQKEYELVGEYVEKYVETKLIETFNLVTLYVPNNNSKDFTKRDENQSQCKILITQDFPTNTKCLMLIQGTGAVRLGQWARSVCINENIILGSMIPYVKKALDNKWSVIIYNPNERRDFIHKDMTIKEFSTMEKHCNYVYKNIVKANNNIKEIYIVAHSMGGECTVQILLDNKEDLLSGKIKKIAFTDSVHGSSYNKLGKEGIDKFRKISRDYIGSDEPVGTFIKSYDKAYGGVDCYSSGHNRHEYTSGSAIEEVFKFFNE